MGLNLSYDIVTNKHQGQRLVDSRLGEGTRFSIYLPLESKHVSVNKHVS